MAEKKTTKKTSTTAKKVPAKKNNTKKEVATKKTTATKKTATEKKEVATKNIEVKEEVKTNNKKVTKEKKSILCFVKQNITTILLCIVSILLIVNIVLVAIGHNVELKDGKEVVVSIDGKKFTAEDLFSDLKKNYGTNTVINMIDNFISDKEIKGDEESKKYAKAQVEAMRQQYEAYGYDFENVLAQYGYNDEDELVDEYEKSYKKEQVVKKYLKENKVTDDEIEKYYDEEIYGDYSVKHILIKSTATSDMSDEEKENAENDAKEKALEVIQKLNDGAEWSTLVKEYSEDTGSVDSDGLIENFTKGDVVDEFFNASVELKNDEYTKEPVKSTYGYHVILKISSTEKPSLEDKKDEIIDELVENYLSNDENLYNTTWVEIRKSYNLKINDSKIEKGYNAIIEQ